MRSSTTMALADASNAPRPTRDDEELALGAWRDGLQDDAARCSNSAPPAPPPVFSLGCDARRNLLLQRHGAAPPGDLPVMLVTVGSETRRLAVAGTGGADPDAARHPAAPTIRSAAC